MALLTPQAVTPAGLAAVYSAANASDTSPPGDNLFLDIKTAGTGTTVTVVSPATVFCGLGASGAAHNNVVTLTATDNKKVGPLTAARYADPTTGLVTINYSSTTTVTAALIQF